MNWLQPDKLRELYNTAQTGAQIINQVRQQISANVQQGEDATLVRAQNELTYTSTSTTRNPSANNSREANQNLHDGFSKEFLKEVANNSRTLLEERRPQDGCTPLLCAVKRNCLETAILLLSHGANVHAVDLSGNSALHHAIMTQSVKMVKLLLIFGADADAQNKAGQAANALKKSSEIAEILTRVRTWKQYGLIERSKPKADEDLQSKIDSSRQAQAIHHQQNKTPEQKANSLRLLSLDGGGIKGLVLIQILMEIEDLCGGREQKDKRKNFIQRNFDWIAGTSTGAILALALADGTPLNECLQMYFRLKDEIFCGYRPYKAECIEGFLKEQFGENRKMADLKSGKTRVFVTVTKADQIPIKLVLFRNYRTQLNTMPCYAPDKMCIWKAARCSSAAPTYFSSVDGLMDGGLMANNPGSTLMLEVSREIDARKFQLLNGPIPDVAFMLSLGTGKIPEAEVSNLDLNISPGVQSILQTVTALTNLKSILVEQLATSDGQVVETARKMAHDAGVPYFRLTPSLHADIQLDTVDNNTLIDMMWNTKVYVREKCSKDMLPLLTLMREFQH